MKTLDCCQVNTRLPYREHIGLYRFLSLCVFIAGALVISRPDQLFPTTPSLPSPLHQDLSQHNIYGFPLQFSAQSSAPPSGSAVDVAGVLACVASVIIASVLLILNR